MRLTSLFNGVGNRYPIATAALSALCAALSASAAVAQTAPAGRMIVPAYSPAIVFPMKRAEDLTIRFVPAFRFAVETLNTGAALPGTPNRLLAEGSGSVARGPRTTGWTIVVERMNIDGLALAAGAPLLTLTVSIDNAQPNERTYNAEYRGLDTLPHGAPVSPIKRIVRGMADTLAFALPMGPQHPVAERNATFDLGPALHRHLWRNAGQGQIVQMAPPPAAAGLLMHRGREAILVRSEGTIVARTRYGDIPMATDTAGAIDTVTGLPLFMQVQAHGTVNTPVARGHVDYTLRFATSLPNMGDPVAVFAPPEPEMPAIPVVSAPSQPAKPKPAAKPADKTPVAKPAAPAAVAKPAAPAAVAKPAAPADDTGKRLESLKSLFDRGLITKEQYEAKQKEILGTL